MGIPITRLLSDGKFHYCRVRFYFRRRRLLIEITILKTPETYTFALWFVFINRFYDPIITNDRNDVSVKYVAYASKSSKQC